MKWVFLDNLRPTQVHMGNHRSRIQEFSLDFFQSFPKDELHTLCPLSLAGPPVLWKLLLLFPTDPGRVLEEEGLLQAEHWYF